jgi:hypothetical protein
VCLQRPRRRADPSRSLTTAAPVLVARISPLPTSGRRANSASDRRPTRSTPWTWSWAAGISAPPPVVRLLIYSDDPGTGKRSSSTGLMMNLSGETHPIVFITVGAAPSAPSSGHLPHRS